MWVPWLMQCLQALKREMIPTLLLLPVCSDVSYWVASFYISLYKLLSVKSSCFCSFRKGSNHFISIRLSLSTDWRKRRLLPSLLQCFGLLHIYFLSAVSFSLWFHTLRILGTKFSLLSRHCSSSPHAFFFFIPCTSQVWHGLCFSP